MINTSTDADLMLYWLSHHGIATKRKLYDRWRKFRGKDMFDTWVLKHLQYLGHVELFERPNSKGKPEDVFVVAPPTILKVAANRFYWVGARTPEIVERWASFFPVETWTEQDKAPFFWGIKMDEPELHALVAEHFVDVSGLKIIENQSLELLRNLPDINSIFKQTIDSDRPDFVFPHNATIERFVVKNRRSGYISVSHLRDDGLYRFRNEQGLVLVRGERRISLLTEPEISAARWFAVRSGSNGQSFPVRFNPDLNRLEVAVNIRLPFFIERALHLLSGRVAENDAEVKIRYYHCDRDHADEILRILNIQS